MSDMHKDTKDRGKREEKDWTKKSSSNNGAIACVSSQGWNSARKTR